MTDNFAGEHVHDGVEPVSVFARAVKHCDVPAPERIRGVGVQDGLGSLGAAARQALGRAVAVLPVPFHDPVGGRDREIAMPRVQHPVVRLRDRKVGVFLSIEQSHELVGFGLGDSVR